MAQRVLESQDARQHLWRHADEVAESPLQVARRHTRARRNPRNAGASRGLHEITRRGVDDAIEPGVHKALQQRARYEVDARRICGRLRELFPEAA